MQNSAAIFNSALNTVILHCINTIIFIKLQYVSLNYQCLNVNPVQSGEILMAGHVNWGCVLMVSLLMVLHLYLQFLTDLSEFCSWQCASYNRSPRSTWKTGISCSDVLKNRLYSSISSTSEMSSRQEQYGTAWHKDSLHNDISRCVRYCISVIVFWQLWLV